MKKSILLLMGVATATLAFASKDVKPVAFNADANVCCIGDSITHNGKYMKNIVLFYVTRYPTDKINFYNVGISGDTAGYANKRLEEDVLSLKPDFATLMIGMNDTKFMREFPNEWFRNKLAENRKMYVKNVDEIIQKCKKANCRLILFAPSPYDKYAQIKEKPVVFAKHRELEYFSDQCRRFAYKYNLPLVDMWNYMKDVNAVIQKEFPEITTAGKDRVHPTDMGGYVMMSNFVRTFGEHREISTVEIDAGKSKLDVAYNCDITNFKADKTSVSFDSFEYSLPFPLNDETKFAEKYIRFAKDYNRQIIKVVGLEKGEYNLLIDGKIVGEYSADDLSKGVNIGNNPKTPQYEQAVETEKASFIFRDFCNELREINATEMWQRLYELDSFEARVKRLETMLKENKIHHPYIRKCATLYKTTKPKQAEMFAKSRELFEQLYKVATPKKHTFELKKINKAN